MFELAGEPRPLLNPDLAALRHIGIEPDKIGERRLERPKGVWQFHRVASAIACLLRDGAVRRAKIAGPAKEARLERLERAGLQKGVAVVVAGNGENRRGIMAVRL